MDWLSPRERTQLVADAVGLLGDPDLARSIEYLRLQGVTHAPSTQITTRHYTITELEAFRGAPGDRDIPLVGDGGLAGVAAYLIPRAALDWRPTAGSDRIADGGESLEVLAVDEDPLGAIVRILARRGSMATGKASRQTSSAEIKSSSGIVYAITIEQGTTSGRVRLRDGGAGGTEKGRWDVAAGAEARQHYSFSAGVSCGTSVYLDIEGGVVAATVHYT